MTTVIVNDSNLVVNIGVGAAEGNPPPGLSYHIVDKSIRVGIGWSLINGEFIPPVIPEPEPEPVTRVTAYQAKVQLSRAGLYDAVQNLINTTTNQELVIAWNTATTFERYSLFIMGVAPELGLTEEQVDNLFLEASKIT